MTDVGENSPIWESRDGRAIPLDDMHTPHIWAAFFKVKAWIKQESDPDVLKDLRAWKRKFKVEINRRKAAGEK
jgi:hypothetical protein